jgi:hypothetical protein
MKGGKGGLGRKKAASKLEKAPELSRSARRGAPKRDWGAIPSDLDLSVTPVSNPRLPTKKKPRT